MVDQAADVVGHKLPRRKGPQKREDVRVQAAPDRANVRAFAIAPLQVRDQGGGELG
ncbi:MAG: hypothetical protein JO120_08305 [Solirubrobacterales bacterium]|nr:hypothetical protein [Solirubrobacterales bacterium]